MKIVDHLFNIKQNEGELTKKIVAKFCEEVSKIKEPVGSIVIKYYKSGISEIERQFYYYIT